MARGDSLDEFRQRLAEFRALTASLPSASADLITFESILQCSSDAFDEHGDPAARCDDALRHIFDLLERLVADAPGGNPRFSQPIYRQTIALARELAATIQIAQESISEIEILKAELVKERLKHERQKERVRGHQAAIAEKDRTIKQLDAMFHAVLKLKSPWLHVKKYVNAKTPKDEVEALFDVGTSGEQAVQLLERTIKEIVDRSRELPKNITVLVGDLVEAAHQLVTTIARLGKKTPALQHAADRLEILEVPADAENVVARGSGLQQREGLNAGTRFRDIDEPWCPQLVAMDGCAAGYLMGSPDSDSNANQNEKPQHLVRISYRFAVGRYPVTAAQYNQFKASQAGKNRGEGGGKLPAVNVSWDDAKAYVKWLSERTGQTYRLLSEAEWEYAARGGKDTSFWWGDEFDPARANKGGRSANLVDRYEPNPFGLHDMLGNVWEWVEDTWHGNYNGAPTDGSAWTSKGENERLARGGSWSGGWPGYLRCAFRQWYPSQGIRANNLGFRVARTIS